MKVLLTDGGHKNTLSIIRHLGRKGVVISIIHHKKSFPAYSRYCKKLYISPHISHSDAYLLFVTELISKEKFDLLIPVGALTVKLFSNHLKELERYTHIIVAEPDKIDLALNKNRTYQLAKELGMHYPETIYPKTLEEAKTYASRLRFPIILKSSNEAVAKFPTIYIRHRQEYTQSLLETFERLNHQLPVIQEMVSGDGYGFYAVYDHGQMVRFFMHRRIRQFPVSGGISSCAESIYEEDLLLAGKKILDHLQWHGQAMVEFIKDTVSGKFFLIEINPKFWGSLDLSIVSGINFPFILCQMATGQVITEPHQYKTGIGFQWIFAQGGELERLKDKPSDWAVVLKSLFNKRFKNDVWWRDPLPNLKQLADLVLRLASK